MGVIGRLDQYGSMLAQEFNENSMSENLIINSTSTSAWNVGTFSTETQFPIKGLHTVRITDLSADGDSPHLTAALITTPGFHTVSHFIDTVNSTCTSVSILIFGSTINGNSYASANFNLSTKTFGAVSYSGTSWANGFTNVVDYGNGIYRISITAEVLLATTATRAYVTPGPANTSYLILAGSQYESGTVATDYTPTFGTAKTRSVASTTNINISSTSKFHSSGFEENTGFTNTLVANTFAPYDPVYDDFGGALFGPGQGRYMRNNSNKNVIVYNEIDEVTDFRDIVRNGLVLDLDAAQPLSYPGYGTTWKDLSGNNNSGILENGIAYNSNNGGSLIFDGVDDSSNFGNILQLGTQSRTYCCWYKLNSTTQIADAALISKTDNAGTSFRQSLGFQSDGNFRIIFRGQGNSIYDMNTTNPNIDLNWHYLVWVINRNSSQFLYQNTNILNSLDISPLVGQDFSLARPLRIGSYNSTTDTPVLFFNGNIAQVSIYNRALTATEITQNYNALKHRFGL